MTYEEEADAIIDKLRYAPIKPIPPYLSFSHFSNTPPVNPIAGNLWLDTVSYVTKIYNGRTWVILS